MRTQLRKQKIIQSNISKKNRKKAKKYKSPNYIRIVRGASGFASWEELKQAVKKGA